MRKESGFKKSNNNFGKSYDNKKRETQDGDKKEYGKKTFEKKSYEKKPFEKKPFEKKTFGKKPFERKEFVKKEYVKKEYVKKDFNKKPFISQVDPINEDAEENNQLEGRNSILEALRADTAIDTILVKKGENEGTIKVIIAMAKEKDIVIKEMTKEKLDQISQTGKHQGVIAYCAAHEYAEIDDIFEKANSKNEKPFIIVLDGITDPHNLGAIIRTANATGVHGVIVSKRRAAGLTAVVGKTSAGALQYVPVARVANISTTIDELKQKGVWIACADMEGDKLYTAKLEGAIALVIGNEGSGVSRLVKEKCDFSVSIPMVGEISSLNASVASGILMYEVLRRRTENI